MEMLGELFYLYGVLQTSLSLLVVDEAGLAPDDLLGVVVWSKGGVTAGVNINTYSFPPATDKPDRPEDSRQSSFDRKW